MKPHLYPYQEAFLYPRMSKKKQQRNSDKYTTLCRIIHGTIGTALIFRISRRTRTQYSWRFCVVCSVSERSAAFAVEADTFEKAAVQAANFAATGEMPCNASLLRDFETAQ